jgi:hypothetical protein
MKGLGRHILVSLQLNFRNRMALIYGYLFPVIFLVAFYVLYRYERVPLLRHVGELLTMTVLGGACFGLPTAMVSERERGVWRRYRLAPVATGGLIGSTVVARYVTILTAGLLQLAIAMLVGMPLPRHPAQLLVAFTFVTFAFIGLGLVIAMLADNVPAVQALGQCIFLPMLIIGGVAVQLTSLPDWALHVSAFFPGRYGVEAIQECVTGAGLGAVRFSLIALLAIGAAGALAGAKLFRWDGQQRFAALRGKAWVAVAIGAWIGVGVLAETGGHVRVNTASTDMSQSSAAPTRRAALPSPVLTPMEREAAASTSAPPAAPQAPAAAKATRAPVDVPSTSAATKSNVNAARSPSPPRAVAPAPSPKAAPEAAAAPKTPAAAPQPQPAPTQTTQTTLCPSAPASWQAVTLENIEDDLVFDRGLPPDTGVVTPIARDDLQPSPDVDEKLQRFGAVLPGWLPAKTIDPVQRVRNTLYAAAVPDVLQLDIERWVPWYVFDQITRQVPKDDLPKILYWIACTPDRGANPAVEDMRALGLPGMPADIEEVRNRAAIYSVKLLGRLLGKI